MYLDYNEENLKIISDIIKQNLKSDLIPKKWKTKSHFYLFLNI